MFIDHVVDGGGKKWNMQMDRKKMWDVLKRKMRALVWDWGRE